MRPTSSFLSKRHGATLAGIFGVALASLVLFCGAGSAPIENFLPQGPMQADLNAGGHSVTNAATLFATNVTIPSGGTNTVNGALVVNGSFSGSLVNATNGPVQLNGSGQLPALDGSQLTGLSPFPTRYENSDFSVLPGYIYYVNVTSGATIHINLDTYDYTKGTTYLYAYDGMTGGTSDIILNGSTTRVYTDFLNTEIYLLNTPHDVTSLFPAGALLQLGFDDKNSDGPMLAFREIITNENVSDTFGNGGPVANIGYLGFPASVTGIRLGAGRGANDTAAVENTHYAGPVTMTSNTTGTVTFNTADHNQTIYNTSGTTISSATITLPTASRAGQVLRYVTAGAITSVTISGTVDAGASLTTLAANSIVAWQAETTAGHWIRIE